MPKMKYYLGLAGFGTLREVFRSSVTPTLESTGGKYIAVIGPFRTKRGAIFMRDHPGPCVVTVQDAERLAKQ